MTIYYIGLLNTSIVNFGFLVDLKYWSLNEIAENKVIL